MAISNLTKIGIAKEAPWAGTADPEYLIPVDPPTIGEQSEQILDEAVRGLATKDYAAYQGVRRVEGTFSGSFYPEECGLLLYSIMGATSFTAGSPNTHTFSVGSHPPSLTIQDENQVESQRFVACMVSELTLSFNAAEGLLRYSATIIGRERTDTIAGAVPAEATNAPFCGWQMACAIGGASFGKLIDGEITLRRPIELGYMASGSQYAGTADAGPLEVTARATIRYDTQADYDRYLDKDQDSFQIDWNRGSGATQKKLTFLATSMDFGDGPMEIDRSGASLTGAYAMRALYNTTDDGPCKFTLLNARDSKY